MSEQHMVRLIDISVMKMGETIIAAQCTGDGYPVYSADTGNEPWNFTNKLKIKNSRGSLVVGARGSIGNPRIPDFDIFGATQTTIVIIPDIKKLEPKYLYYALKALDFKTLTAQQAVPMLTIGDISKIKIPYIDKIAQKSVTAILEVIDQAIEKTEALIHKYQQIKVGLMHDLFTRGVTADGKLRPPRKQAPELYKETPIGWIPKVWDYESISSVMESLVDGPFGSNLKTEHYVIDPGVRVVRLQNIQATVYNDIDKAYVSEKHANYLIRNKVISGDILIAGLGEDRYPVGRACQFAEKLPPAINKADCFRLRCKATEADNSFVMFYLNTPNARFQIRRYEQGVTRPRINLGNMKKIVIPTPLLQEQKEISKRIRSIELKIKQELLGKAKLEEEKKGLMHDLLTGKVPVKIDQKETAHV